MSDYSATSVTLPATVFGGRRFPPVTASILAGGSATTTYYYITTGGARGSTTDIGSIPVGAVVMRASP